MILKLTTKERKEILPDILDDIAKTAIREQISPVIKKHIDSEIVPKIQNRLNDFNIDSYIKNCIRQNVDKIIGDNFCDREKSQIAIGYRYSIILSEQEKTRIQDMISNKIVSKIPFHKLQDMALQEIKKKIANIE